MPRVSMPEPTPNETDDPSFPAEDPASLRRTFIILTFVAGCVCLPPRQWVSAGILGVLSGYLFFRHTRITKRELALRPKPSPKPDLASRGGPSEAAASAPEEVSAAVSVDVAKATASEDEKPPSSSPTG